jgi:hypothetical protein
MDEPGQELTSDMSGDELGMKTTEAVRRRARELGLVVAPEDTKFLLVMRIRRALGMPAPEPKPAPPPDAREEYWLDGARAVNERGLLRKTFREAPYDARRTDIPVWALERVKSKPSHARDHHGDSAARK